MARPVGPQRHCDGPAYGPRPLTTTELMSVPFAASVHRHAHTGGQTPDIAPWANQRSQRRYILRETLAILGLGCALLGKGAFNRRFRQAHAEVLRKRT